MIPVRRWMAVAMLAAAIIVSPQHVRAQESKLARTWNKLQVWLDSLAVKKVDKNYIKHTDKPWRFSLRPKLEEFDMTVDATIDHNYARAKGIKDIEEGGLKWGLHFDPPLAQSLGFYFGYRGLGIGYSVYLRNKTGNTLTLSSNGSRFGLNVRLRSFSTHDVMIDALFWGAESEPLEIHSPGVTNDPIHLLSAIIDGYYIFNSRRFSQSAAYSQSVEQIRSAGSVILGAMYHQSSLDMASDHNALLVLLNGDVGKFSVQQLNIGVGYGYNWVPWRGWLFNVMFMPTVSLLNRVKSHFYDCNFQIFIDEETEEHKFFPPDGEWEDAVRIWEKESVVNHGKIHLNADARASITYTGQRFYVNVYGQLNSFNYNYAVTDVKLVDWYIRGSLGIRF